MKNALKTLLYAEWLHFKTEKSLLLFALLILLAGGYGIYSGHAEIQHQRANIEHLDYLYQDNIAELKTKFPDSADAGDIGYYHSTFARHMPDSWAALSIGQRDANPYYIKLRLLAVHNQLYSSENTNPDKLATGSFDLAFVLVFLLPLFIVAICFNLFSAEKERGTLALVLSQPVCLSTFLLGKLLFRFGLVMLLVVLLTAVGIIFTDAQPDGRVLVWLGATTLYCLFWFGLCYAVIVLKKSSAFNAICLLGVWLLLTIILPVVINVTSQIKRPVTEGLALTLKQREEVHAGWDKPKDETFKRFFASYPQYRNTSPVTGRFAWKWYFAFQELGDRSVESLYQTYLSKLQSRAELANRLSMVSAPATFQVLLNAVGGTDLQSHLGFVRSARQFHHRLKAFYYPFLFNDQPFRNADFQGEPRHVYQAKPDTAAIGMAMLILLVSTALVFALAFVLQLFTTSELK
jgi:ABC-2 type transport system permease protein